MGLFDFTKGAYKDFKQALTGETDITCPKCGKSKLYMVDGIMQKTAVCPECHYNLEDEIRKNGGQNPSGGGPAAPSSGLLMY